jgi:hypothetical protein
MFNVGCDETWDLGQGRSKDECAARGAGRVYLDFLLKIHREVTDRGRQMQFWGDIILQHPELVADLPKDVIALEWGYEAAHPFDARGAQFAAAGLQFYVCPGTSSWNTIAGRTDNCLGNTLSAAENGLKHGATGYLNTDWGDNGHWQPLPVSYLGYAAGAAYAWALEANREAYGPPSSPGLRWGKGGEGVTAALSRYAFDDATGNMGKAAYDLGNVYRAVGIEPGNASTLFGILQMPLEQVRGYKDTLTPEAFHRALEAIDAATAPLSQSACTRPDAALIQREFNFAAHALRHACYRALYATGAEAKDAPALDADLAEIISEHQKVWKARNRPGGLVDSVARFKKARKDYSLV